MDMWILEFFVSAWILEFFVPPISVQVLTSFVCVCILKEDDPCFSVDMCSGNHSFSAGMGKLLRDVEPELMDGLIHAIKGDLGRLQELSCAVIQITMEDEIEKDEDSEYEEKEEVLRGCQCPLVDLTGEKLALRLDGSLSNEVSDSGYLVAGGDNLFIPGVLSMYMTDVLKRYSDVSYGSVPTRFKRAAGDESGASSF